MKLVTGDIFEDDADAIVIPVNCVGTLGKGLALEAKKRWPDVEQPYKSACLHRYLRPGGMWPVAVLEGDVIRPVWLAATKDHWRQPSRSDWVESICQRIGEVVREHQYSMAVPALGCGLGGLDWAEVLPIMERHFKDIDVRVYAPREDR